MATFEYTAFNEDSKTIKGALEGDSVRQIRQKLRDQGLIPIEVQSSRVKQTGAQSFSTNLRIQKKLGPLDQVLFTRQLATLIASGLPLEEALLAVAQQSEKQVLTTLIMSIRSKVLEGHTLASSLSEYPSSFNSMYRSTVSAGEQSGYLDKVLDNLAQYSERQYEARRNVEMALLYPMILTVFAFLLVGMLMIYVVPDMVGMLLDMDQELPLSTSILIGLSNLVSSYWWGLALIGFIFVAAIRKLMKQPNIRISWDRRILNIPILKGMSKNNSSARYANTLSILTSSGVPLVDAMDIASEVISNQWLKRKLNDATQRVSEGSSLRSALETTEHFPPMLLHMVASGEKSGQLDIMLEKVATYQQSELERTVTALVRLFEPLMLVIMGGTVMFIVIAVLLPIMNMNQLI